MATGFELTSDSANKTKRRTSNESQDIFSYDEVREEVLKLITSSIQFTGTSDFITYIRDDGCDMQEANEQFTARKGDLMEDCAVVIAGETSAGKSTIINKIIGGSKLLPTKVTASTTKVCRVGYSKSFSVSTKDCKGKELKTLKFPNREDLSETVKQLVTENSTEFVYVDIGIPLPMLQGNVLIVDTPGIGDKDQKEVEDMMLDYIPKALAIVFVLNVSNAGGIQHDRLTRVIKHVRDYLTKMPCFCPDEAIFVLNKWDTILEEDHRREFLDITKEKLHELWKEIDDNNIFKLAAASEENKYQAMFEDFLKVLKDVIDKNENKRIEIHLDFLKKHLDECNRVVSTKLRFAGQTTTKSRKNLHQAQKELNELENILKEAKSDLQRTIEFFVWNAADRLYRFIHTVDFKKEILSNTEKITRIGIEKELKKRIEQRITVWHGENIEHIFMETFLKIHGERFMKIHEKLHIIKDDMQGIKTPFTAYPRIAAALASSIGSSGTGLLGSLIVSRFLGSPYVAVGVATVGIMGGLLVAALVALNLQDDYDTIREKAYTAIMDTFSMENIQKEMHASYEKDIETIVHTFMEGELQKEINNLKKNIETMLRHLDDYRNDEVALRNLRSKISLYIEQLNAVARMKIQSI